LILQTKLGSLRKTPPQFSPLGRLSKAHTRSATICVDEFDAGFLKGTSYNFQGRTTRFARPSFQLMHRYDPDARSISKFLLAPRKEPAACSALRGRNHPRYMPDSSGSYNSIENLLTSHTI
jgi:hypothetical protein